MSGFEFTPAGMVPLGAYREPQKTGDVAAVVPADVAAAPLSQGETTVYPQYGFTSRPPAPVAPLSPKDVIRLAKARLKEVEREIRLRGKLEAERDKLKRLLDAAAGKTLAIVRSLPTRAAKPA